MLKDITIGEVSFIWKMKQKDISIGEMSFIWKTKQKDITIGEMKQEQRYKLIKINKLTPQYYGNIDDLDICSYIKLTSPLTSLKKRFLRTLLPTMTIYTIFVFQIKPNSLINVFCSISIIKRKMYASKRNSGFKILDKCLTERLKE